MNCPICATLSPSRFGESPYWMCPSCDCWFQSPLPPKIYEGAHEKDVHGDSAGHLMSDHDKDVNRELAEYLFRDWLGKPAKTLDIGSKFPYLAHCLRDLGCEAFGMDNIDVVPEYSRSLGVPMLMADFEQISEAQICEWAASFRLITLIHVFEHMYDSLAALRKLRRLVADDGVLFIRLPDHRVSGFERDLTPGHYSIHPYFHALGSVLELLVQGGDLFSVAHTYVMEGAGQRDIILRPLTRKPTVYAGLIVKDEERDLPRCLKSIEPVVDGVVIVDTGSTDRTLEVATSTKPVYAQVYTGASRLEDGDWKLWDFSKARNVFVDEIEKLGDYVLWMDADDELLTPTNLRRALYWSQYDVFGVQVESAGQRWTHHRLWKTGLGIRFEGRCHEYPTIGGHPMLVLTDSVIRHDAAPGLGETANERNLRILLEEFADKPSPRTAFYLANTHKDAQRYSEAIPWYGKRIDFGPGYRDEWLFAYLYKARCERAAGLSAEATLLEAVSKERWSEFWMELAYIAYEQRRYGHAVGYAMQAVDAPIPETQLWRETNKYTDQPCRMISWCYEHMGDTAKALEWAKIAREKIGAPDVDWDARIARLKGVPAIVGKAMDVICVRRSGAIGDVLMTLNLLPALKAANPDSKIWYFTDPKLVEYDALGWIIAEAGADQVLPSSAFDACGIKSKRAIDLVGYPLKEGYPDKPMHRHLLEYFGEELCLPMAWYKGSLDLDTGEMEPRGVELPALTVRRPKQIEISDCAHCADQGYITLQRKAGWSKYKEWDKWDEVLEELTDLNFVFIDASEGRTLQQSITVFANARMHMGIDSFCNHLTNYYWTDEQGNGRRVPGVILWGSTQASAAGYASNTNISLGLPCQPCFRENPAISRMPRGPCVNPPRPSYDDDTPWACTRDISVEQVVEAVRAMWEAGC